MLSEQLQAFKQAVIKHTQAKEELSVSLKKRIALVPLLIYFFPFVHKSTLFSVFFSWVRMGRGSSVWIVSSLVLTLLSPNSDQHQFSPNHIRISSRDKVMRINKMIAKEKCLDHLLNSLK